ncbi:hypothetical protein CIB84_013934 [Bambusicola thoracicus]|uniref:Uncharacterized protein n=1 Tax=Bambusicola thoracicus TaxID=9083 RepID=A0A2P4SDY5_BAMTH|nr:hypothetical protein CIB84_013934 [Bambusicola thoracicus]
MRILDLLRTMRSSISGHLSLRWNWICQLDPNRNAENR